MSLAKPPGKKHLVKAAWTDGPGKKTHGLKTAGHNNLAKPPGQSSLDRTTWQQTQLAETTWPKTPGQNHLAKNTLPKAQSKKSPS